MIVYHDIGNCIKNVIVTCNAGSSTQLSHPGVDIKVPTCVWFFECDNLGTSVSRTCLKNAVLARFKQSFPDGSLKLAHILRDRCYRYVARSKQPHCATNICIFFLRHIFIFSSKTYIHLKYQAHTWF